MPRPKLLQATKRRLAPWADTKRIWKLLVDYIDGGEAWELVMYCALRHRLFPPEDSSEFAEVRMLARDRALGLEEAFVSSGAAYRERFENLLRWLAAPIAERNRALKATAFLSECQSSEYYLPIEPFDYSTDTEDGTLDGQPLYLEDMNFATIAAPVCRFIRDRVALYQDGDIPLAEAVPVRICPHCSKLFVPERTGRKGFCSSRCAALHAQAEMREGGEYADYIFLCRLERLKLPKLRKRLEKPKAANRLRAIVKGRPKLAGRAKSLLNAGK